MGYKNILVHQKGNIAHVVLHRPEVLNALNRSLVEELGHAAGRIVREGFARVLIISGSEGNFAAGADVAPMADLTPAEAEAFCFNDVFNELEALPVPVIAAISGFALGGGMELALACDFRICGKDAKMGFPEIKLGIFPGAGGTQRLPRLIGVGRAREMIYLGEIIDADIALQYGLCSRVVTGDPVVEALKMAATLATRPPVALACAKGVINLGMNAGLKEGIAFEQGAWADLFSTADQKEGMNAFLEKRKPDFLGK
ncbi:MAG TPA: enoyl-CoA hydratase-related protein [Spirochaetota bacterium]|nr:enoyl-CoA hydratase-related protein [Spirochaetota bacterium]